MRFDRGWGPMTVHRRTHAAEVCSDAAVRCVYIIRTRRACACVRVVCTCFTSISLVCVRRCARVCALVPVRRVGGEGRAGVRRVCVCARVRAGSPRPHRRTRFHRRRRRVILHRFYSCGAHARVFFWRGENARGFHRHHASRTILHGAASRRRVRRRKQSLPPPRRADRISSRPSVEATRYRAGTHTTARACTTTIIFVHRTTRV